MTNRDHERDSDPDLDQAAGGVSFEHRQGLIAEACERAGLSISPPDQQPGHPISETTYQGTSVCVGIPSVNLNRPAEIIKMANWADARDCPALLVTTGKEQAMRVTKLLDRPYRSLDTAGLILYKDMPPIEFPNGDTAVQKIDNPAPQWRLKPTEETLRLERDGNLIAAGASTDPARIVDGFVPRLRPADDGPPLTGTILGLDGTSITTLTEPVTKSETWRRLSEPCLPAFNDTPIAVVIASSDGLNHYSMRGVDAAGASEFVAALDSLTGADHDR